MTLYSNDPTYSDIKEEIRGEIHENHIGEISGNKLQKVLVDMVDDTASTVSSYIGDLSYLQTTDKSNIVAAVNEITTNIADKADDNTVVHNTGDETIAGTKTFSDGINMSNTKVSGVQAPTQDNDAATKKYVDEKTPDVLFIKGNGENSSVLKGSAGTANGRYSSVFGRSNQTLGDYASAFGYVIVCKNSNEFGVGSYNFSRSGAGDKSRTTSFSIGIGTSESDRKNAVEVMKNGDAYIKGIGGYDGTNPSTDKSLQSIITSITQSLDGVDELLRTLIYGE